MKASNNTSKINGADHLVLGLDTGGTNTDAVLFHPETQKILQIAKDYTTHFDLSIGIRGAIKKLLEKIKDTDQKERIKSVNISTTLATNAIAEGMSHKVGLILVGFDKGQDIVQELIQKLPSCSPIFIDGGHDFYGREVAPLDEETLKTEVAKIKFQVRAWAVSSFFSIKNPAHEMKVAEIIEELTRGWDQPITLGQNLTGELGAARRAATAALNAGLVLIIEKLLDAVKQSLVELDLNVPLMVVKGDGGVASELWARERPIETVVSGPAAGILGAKILAKDLIAPEDKNIWILDVGGTTSDLAYLIDDKPKTNVEGAVVGQWTTMVEAVETTTRGLGGDSLVDFDDDKDIILGPRRVLPLCRLAKMYPHALELISPGAHSAASPTYLCRFFIPNLTPDPGINEHEEEILRLLQSQTPLTFDSYQQHCLYNGYIFPGIKFLTHPSVMVSAFTPTDAMATLGLFNEGDPRASIKAAYLLGGIIDKGPKEFSEMVLDRCGQLMDELLVSAALRQDEIIQNPKDFGKKGLIYRSISKRNQKTLAMDLSLSDPVILLGAPVGTLLPWAQKFLKARFIAPPRFEVASAIGAATTTVSLMRRVDIVTLPNLKTYRAFLPDRFLDSNNLNDLVASTSQIMGKHMRNLARIAGAGDDCPITFTRNDRSIITGDGGNLPMGSILKFTAGETGTGELLEF
ncbi:MAG: hydantoinase/oxoprolinase family protein [Deltaproteobacteria bacterium]|jgi:N-methylhydantoinase A/oxoprolinase/acetone carboxylase beta subunit|nr:hydantoinase/oxoprolinase family protein [Deltaproteobacteria bacterium]